jgi:hypothetical protein
VDPAIFYAQGVLGPPSPIPTPCLLLKNVWRLEQTGELGWETEITEDMQEELSKCGQLLHMHVDTASQVGRWVGGAVGWGLVGWGGAGLGWGAAQTRRAGAVRALDVMSA